MTPSPWCNRCDNKIWAFPLWRVKPFNTWIISDTYPITAAVSYALHYCVPAQRPSITLLFYFLRNNEGQKRPNLNFKAKLIFKKSIFLEFGFKKAKLVILITRDFSQIFVYIDKVFQLPSVDMLHILIIFLCQCFELLLNKRQMW